jgi:hypothetical protein
VLHVQQIGIVRWNQPVEPPLAIQEWSGAEINAIQPEEIERVIARLATAGIWHNGKSYRQG